MWRRVAQAMYMVDRTWIALCQLMVKPYRLLGVYRRKQYSALYPAVCGAQVWAGTGWHRAALSGPRAAQNIANSGVGGLYAGMVCTGYRNVSRSRPFRLYLVRCEHIKQTCCARAFVYLISVSLIYTKQMSDVSDDEADRRGFRVNSAQLFITYAQCPCTPEGILHHLTELMTRKHKRIIQYIIARELHEDGEFHIHAYLKLSAPLSTRDPRLIDLGEPGQDAYCHPNWGNVRNKEDVIQYCTKSEETGAYYISNFDVSSELEKVAGKDCHKRALDPSVSVTDGIAMIQKGDPKSWCIHHESIEAALKKAKKPKPPVFRAPYATASFGRVPAAALDWLSTSFRLAVPGERDKCLIVIGPSRMGKSLWARSLTEKHMYFNGEIAFENWKEDAELLIIDDIPWKEIPFKKILLTKMNMEARVTSKYQRNKLICVNMPAIVLMSEADALIDEVDYWNTNATIVRLYSPLF